MIARVLRAGALAAAALLPLGVLGVVLALAINLPWLDEWEWTDLLYHAHAGTLTFAELWKPHNEHRIFVADVIMLALARLGGWNIVTEQCFSLAAVVAAQVAAWRLIGRTVDAALVPPVFLCASLLLYSLGQVDNFANGFQLGWPICTFALLLCALLLTAPARRPWHLGVALVAAAAASFSSSQGLLIWPVGVVWLLLARDRSRTALAVWAVAGAAAFVADRAGNPTGPHASAHDAAGLIAYTFAYLGGPLAEHGRVPWSIAAGVLTLAGVIASAAYDLRARDAAGFARRLPWYGLALYALLGAAATASARLDLGVSQALSSRYLSIASMLDIALAAIAASYATGGTVLRRRAAVALIACMGAATIPAYRDGFEYWVRYRDARATDLGALRAGQMDKLGDLYPNAGELARFVSELRELRDGPFHP